MAEFVPDSILEIFILIDHVFLYSIFSLTGILNNVINIFVFVKMGLRDTINISLACLSVSDLCMLTLSVLVSVSYYPVLQTSGFVAPKWPYFYFKRISRWIMAYITCERCLCIVLPLRVRRIITPTRTFLVIVVIILVVSVVALPAYIPASAKLNSSTNTTTSAESATGRVSMAMTILTFTWFLSCTAILVYSLKKTSKWRTDTVENSNSETLSKRDVKVIKMVAVLFVIFFAVFLPESALLLPLSVKPDFTTRGRYRNLLLLLFGVTETPAIIHASLDILIYLKMSSKYRKTFELHVFRIGQVIRKQGPGSSICLS